MKVEWHRVGRKKRRIGRILLYVILVLIVLFAGLAMGGMKLTYDEQFGRFERPDPAVTTEMRFSDLTGLYPQELVTFYSGKNRLQGYLYHNPLSPGLIVVAHGLGGGADSYLPQITYFLDQGWSVFAYDATGSYDSEGEGVGGFPQGILDLDAALTYLASRPDLRGLPLLLFGHSWGGYSVVNVLHFGHDVAGVVSIAAPNSSMEIMMEQGSQMLGSVMQVLRPFVWLYERIVFGRTASLTAVDAINKSMVPVMIIHGTGDQVVRIDGSAIINKRGQITNPHAKFVVLDEENRNGHNNILQSIEAQAYANELNAELRQISQQYDGEIPYDVRKNFFAEVDRARFNELNLDLMNKINDFFLECL